MCVCHWVISLQALLAFCWLERKLVTVLSCSGEEDADWQRGMCTLQESLESTESWRDLEVLQTSQLAAVSCFSNSKGSLQWIRLVQANSSNTSGKSLTWCTLSFKPACAPLASSVPVLPVIACQKSISSYLGMSSFKASQACKGSSWK